MHAPIDLSGDAHSLLCRLSVSSSLINVTTGLIPGCTVAKANVEAKGKVLWLDANGKRTNDPKLVKREIPIFTDDKFLDTLMAAIQDAGGRLKVREDHDDSIGARAGTALAFKRDGDRVTTDIHLLDSYRNRGVVLEVATKTPQAIGLSIDFVPDFEVIGERALMRVVEISAVDIVDEGAVTPDGLLLSARVDTAQKVRTPLQLKTEPVPPMPDAPKSPTSEEIMAAVGALKKNIDDCMAAVKLLAPPAPAAADTAAMAAIKEQNVSLAANLAKLTDGLEAIRTEQVRLKKERLLLGFRGSDADRAALGSKTADELETLAAGQKTYLQLVDEEKAKCATLKAGEIHERVRMTAAGKAAYRLHIESKGIVKAA